LKEYIKNFYSNNFVYNGKEKLSKLTVFFIILLNLFIFITLGLGIDFQIKVLNSPSVTFPYKCRDIVNNNNLTDFNQYIYSNDKYYNYYEEDYQEIKDLQLDSRCVLIYDKLEEIKKEHKIKNLVDTSNKLINSENKINSELSYIRENYNTVLFEKMSSQVSDKSIIKDGLSSQNIKEKYDSYVNEIERIKKEKDELYKNFSNSKIIEDFISYISLNKEQINEDIESLTKAYFIKKELVTLGFLLPLVFLFFYMMKRYLTKEKYILYILFKNILIVTLIPSVISIISLVYEFLPKIFIEKVLKFFYELEVPFIVYYFVIAIFIFIFGFLIIKLQKKFKEENNRFKNNSITKVEAYNKNICNLCGNNVDYKTMNFCPCCKNQLKIECKSCNEKTIKTLDYCYNCGNDIKEK
jgi:hypothetical protein